MDRKGIYFNEIERVEWQNILPTLIPGIRIFRRIMNCTRHTTYYLKFIVSNDITQNFIYCVIIYKQIFNIDFKILKYLIHIFWILKRVKTILKVRANYLTHVSVWQKNHSIITSSYTFIQNPRSNFSRHFQTSFKQTLLYKN